MKTTTRIAALLLSLAMLLTLGVVLIGAEDAATPAAPTVWDGTADTTWYDANSTTKTATLTTASQLAGFSELSKTNNFYEWTIKLGADIVLNEGNASDWATTAPTNTWTPISEFWGTFDGQGYKISGLYINQPTAPEIGLFAKLNGATVKNFSIVNAYVCGRYQVGSVAGIIVTAFGAIENVYSDAIVYAYPCSDGKHDGAQVGGILGANATALSTITGCWFSGKVYGVADGDPLNPTDYTNDNQASQVGGIVGVSTKKITIKDCLVDGHVEAHSQVGGIVGRFISESGHVLENCLMLGDVKVSRWTNNKCFAGEFIGIIFSGLTATLTNCYGLSTYEATYEDIVEDGNRLFKTAAFSSNGTGTVTDGSTFDRFTADDLKGDGAKTKLVGFDFDTVWKTVADGTPVLTMTVKADEPASGDDDDNSTTEAPTAPVDTPTEAPTTPTETPTEAPTTDNGNDNSTGTDAASGSNGGCASSVGGVAVVCLPVLGALLGLKRRKKED